MPETDTAEKLTFQEAFAAAREEHSVEEQATDDAAGTEATIGDTETAQPPAETSDEAAGQPEATAEEDEGRILSKEDEAKLSPELKATYRKMQKSFTQKTQKLSAKYKDAEQDLELGRALRSNPTAVIEAIATQTGMKLVKGEVQKGDAPTTPEVSGSIGDELKKDLGPELAWLADRLAPAIERIVERKIGPTQQGLNEVVAQSAAAETNATMTAFGEKYKGWEKYEPKMLEIARRVQPTDGQMTDYEYMELLYTLARAGETEAESTKRAIQRINGAAEKAESSESGIPTSRVAPAAPSKRPTFKQAFEAAKRGEVWS